MQNAQQQQYNTMPGPQGPVPAPLYQMPPTPQPPQLGQFMGPFQTGLCSCFSDCGICCCGWLCLPCTFGYNVEEALGDSCFGNCMLYACCSCCACVFAGPKRRQIRTKYNLVEEPCSDCCVHCWCSPCAVCQEARQIKYMRQALQARPM